MKQLFVLLFIIIVMVACGAPPNPTPDPNVLVPTAVPTPARILEPTQVAAPSSTATLVIQPGASTQAVWTNLNSQPGGFVVTAPGTFVEQAQTVNTAVGAIQLHLFGLNRGDTYYAVGYSDYPEAVIKETKPNDLLNNAVDGAVGNTNAKLVSRVLGLQDNIPGVEFKGDIPPKEGQPLGATIQGRMFLKGQRLYQVFCIVTSGKEALAEIDRYLNSFRFVTD